MTKSDLTYLPTYFDRYINLVPDLPLIESLESYGKKYLEEIVPQLLALAQMTYEQGKWTGATILQHLIDTERVFTYRAMGMSRGDLTNFPSFDENLYARNSNANSKSILDLIYEFGVVRESTILFYKSLLDEAIIFEGLSSGNSNNPLALGYTMTGHVIHHVNILKERYFPLLVAKK